MKKSKLLLEVKNLSISFTQYTKGLNQKEIEVIRELDIDVHEGEILAIVGSSGSGKSLLAHAILGILPNNAHVQGEIKYNGEILTDKLKERLRGKEISLIPQSVNYLNPLMKIKDTVRSGSNKQESIKKQREIFKRYDLKEKVENLYPFQISGGMARRVLVSTASLTNSKLIIADEPTPGIHEEALMETLTHFRELANEGKGIILITHDIETGLKIADRVAVFYAGTTIEIANASDFNKQGNMLRHPYTKSLWKALPQNDFEPIEGCQPYCATVGNGCAFYSRCKSATENCLSKISFKKIRNGMVRCLHAD